MRKSSGLLAAAITGAIALTVGVALPMGAAAAPPPTPPPSQPSQPVTVTNTADSPVPVAVTGMPAVSSSQSGDWNVGATQLGTWNVNVANAPVVHPKHPGSFFFERMQFFNTTRDTVSSNADVVYIDSITAANDSGAATKIFVVAAISDDGCQTFIGGGSPGLYIVVPAQSTQQLTFPTPLEFRRLSSGQPNCIGASVVTGSGADMTVSGYTS